MDKEQERDDTQAEHGKETEAPAPVVRLSAEDIAAIASTVAQILQRQEKGEPTSGAGDRGSSSTVASIDPPGTHSQSGKEVLESRGQPRSVVACRSGDRSCQNGMGLEAPQEWDGQTA